MNKLDEKFITEMKEELEQKRSRTIKDLENITVGDENTPEGRRTRFPDRGDAEDENAQEVAVFSDRLSLGKSLQNTLKDIDKALEDITAGKYGACKHCGQAIEEKRLRARPHSSSCIDCKKRLKGEE
jgi:DnaK suppressor protein